MHCTHRSTTASTIHLPGQAVRESPACLCTYFTLGLYAPGPSRYTLLCFYVPSERAVLSGTYWEDGQVYPAP